MLIQRVETRRILKVLMTVDFIIFLCSSITVMLHRILVEAKGMTPLPTDYLWILLMVLYISVLLAPVLVGLHWMEDKRKSPKPEGPFLWRNPVLDIKRNKNIFYALFFLLIASFTNMSVFWYLIRIYGILLLIAIILFLIKLYLFSKKKDRKHEDHPNNRGLESDGN